MNNKSGEVKVIINHHSANPVQYNDDYFLHSLKIDLTNKIAELGATEKYYTNAQSYIERYLDIVALTVSVWVVWTVPKRVDFPCSPLTT